MDRDELIFSEYKLYAEQKEKFIDRNFRTNRFYMASIALMIIALIYTNNIVFLNHISATLIFAFLGVAISALWWMNVDSYNILIKIKFSDVIEKIEEKFPIKPYTEEFKGIQNYRDNKIFMFSDIQKFIAVVSALFFFAICISELTPIVIKIIDKVIKLKSGI